MWFFLPFCYPFITPAFARSSWSSNWCCSPRRRWRSQKSSSCTAPTEDDTSAIQKNLRISCGKAFVYEKNGCNLILYLLNLHFLPLRRPSRPWNVSSTQKCPLSSLRHRYLYCIILYCEYTSLQERWLSSVAELSFLEKNKSRACKYCPIVWFSAFVPFWRQTRQRKTSRMSLPDPKIAWECRSPYEQFMNSTGIMQFLLILISRRGQECLSSFSPSQAGDLAPMLPKARPRSKSLEKFRIERFQQVQQVFLWDCRFQKECCWYFV